ncbi:MAG: D-alanyl-D-alanine carboxypeptidase/D-alanyl-D-alanine-endopeptidase [Paludibacteraceae bacterium]|nr:D-alanyl-D-alanine carboxypeptidase/D-alanyl-D-alanine-endopeptidase [Paludibacteraceae bacterium]
MKHLFPIICVVECLSVGVGYAETANQFFASDALTANANVGVLVTDVKTGEVIDALGENRLLPTASTMKVLTTCTALELLGESYQWSTFVETDGAIANGVLEGNMYLRGTGDPTIESRKLPTDGFLQTCVRKLQSLGIQKINGSIIADMSAWNNDEAVNRGWLWEDMGNYYAPGIFPLSYQDNTLEVTLASGDSGTIARVLDVKPTVEDLQIDSRVRCTRVSYDNAYAFGRPMDPYRVLTGEIPSNRGRFVVKTDMPDPGLVLAQQLKKHLSEAGVVVGGGVESQLSVAEDTVSRKCLWEYRSPALKEVVAVTNQKSDNLFAESVFRTLAADHPGSGNEARRRMLSCWSERGVDLSQSILTDGCGLAPQNGVSPQTMVQLLQYMYRSPHFDAFLASLPVSGKSGTLRTFLENTPLAGKVYAKSGTIAHLKAYAGYIYLSDNRVWAFSVVVNNAAGSNREVQKSIEKYLLALTSY